MHKFSPTNAGRLESEDRYRFLPPEDTLKRFGLTKGMTFVDIGAGTGFFTRAGANIVGDEGRAFAVEMSEQMVDHLRKKRLPKNMEVIRSEEYEVPLNDAVSDLTWLAFVTHENPDIRRFVREASRVTKRDGTIVILEWKKQEEEHGPVMEERLDHVDLKRAIGEFKIVEDGDLNPSHYYIVLENKNHSNIKKEKHDARESQQGRLF